MITIRDGQTLVLLPENEKTFTIRPAIDTPEYRQPYGKRTKQVLSALTVVQKPVAIRLVDIDRYQRIVGRIYVDDPELKLIALPSRKYSTLPVRVTA